MIEFSNAAGALCITKRGGIPAMPELKDIMECMESVPRLIERV
jgi:sugar/nucleoside kinase (ribokinase family)